MASSVSIQRFFSYCVSNSLPTAIYRLPGEKRPKVIAQNTSKLKRLSLTGSSRAKERKEKGFAFAPFVTTSKQYPVIIQPDVFCDEKNLPELNFAKKQRYQNPVEQNKNIAVSSKHEFEALIKSIKQKIDSKEFSKVVAARVIEKKLPRGFKAVEFFRALCSEYPRAFVSLVFIPRYGIWVGATPETLLKVKNGVCQTFSLAGTKATAQQSWTDKEYEEQNLVTDYITRTLNSVSKTKLKVTGPKTIKAGNLFHLLTTFTVQRFDTKKWKQILHQLHPTPAVAGLPKTKAMPFILENEKSNRNFYSGYLGPVNLEKQINLFVNIRCMQLLESRATIYVGCGITAASNATMEWNETNAKGETLLRVLNKI